MKENNNNSIIVSNQEPYPQIKVNEHSIKYVKLLSQDFASSEGEITAIYQYMYQSWILNTSYPEISKTLEKIAIVEMHHLNIIAKLIVLLGGNPEYEAWYNSRSVTWSANMINYTNNIKQILKYDIKLESCAIDEYTAQSKYIKDYNISKILEHITLDERLHKKIFENFLSNL